MQTFGLPFTPLLQRTLRLKACKKLIVMQKNSLPESWFINDFHRRNSMAAQREVQQMSLHPCSREQKLAQIARVHKNQYPRIASRGDKSFDNICGVQGIII